MNKQVNKLKIFEVYVLGYLFFEFIVIGILSFYYKQWGLGIIIILMSFLFGIIGQGLKHNRTKTFNELAKGPDYVFKDGDENVLKPNQDYEIGRPFFLTCWIVIITSAIILFHQGFRWYAVLPLAFLVGTIYPIMHFFFGIFLTWLSTIKYFFTCWIVIIISAILLFYRGFSWYLVVLLAILLGIVYSLLLFLFGIILKSLKTKK